MHELNALTTLQNLNLDGTGVTIAGLMMLTDLRLVSGNYYGRDLKDEHLAILRRQGQFDKCQVLNLGRTKVTDGGMPSLNGLTKLEALVLTRTKVSDAGMTMLTQLPSLNSLYVDFTRVTAAGEKQIRMNLRNCNNVVR